MPVFVPRETLDSLLVHGVLSRCPGTTEGKVMQRALPFVAFGKLEAFGLPKNLPVEHPTPAHVQAYIAVVMERMVPWCAAWMKKHPEAGRAQSFQAFVGQLSGLRIACWCDPFRTHGATTDCCYVRALCQLFEAIMDVDRGTEASRWPALPERMVLPRSKMFHNTVTSTLVEEAWAPPVEDVEWKRVWLRVLESTHPEDGVLALVSNKANDRGLVRFDSGTSLLDVKWAWETHRASSRWSGMCSFCNCLVRHGSECACSGSGKPTMDVAPFIATVRARAFPVGPH